MTPHPEVNAVLAELLGGARSVLGDRFFAMYLYGSLSSGGFNAKTSDIDFLVVTDGRLPDPSIAGLDSLHRRLWDSGMPWADRLEGKYVPKGELRRYQAGRAPTPTVNEGRFYLDGEGSDWIIQRHVIRESGLAVSGPPPAELIDPVPPEHLKESVLRIMEEWWAPMLGNPEFLRNGGYQAFAVLTMCRTLLTLEQGRIASKADSAAWAAGALEPRWKPLIAVALAMPHDGTDNILTETLAFIRYTNERCRTSRRYTI